MVHFRLGTGLGFVANSWAAWKRRSFSSSCARATKHAPKGLPLYLSCSTGTVAVGYPIRCQCEYLASFSFVPLPAAHAWTQNAESTGPTSTSTPYSSNTLSRISLPFSRRLFSIFLISSGDSVVSMDLIRSVCSVKAVRRLDLWQWKWDVVKRCKTYVLAWLCLCFLR